MVYSLQITIKSFDTQRIKECQNEIHNLYVTLHPTQNDGHGKNAVALPTKRSHITVLRSPHIDKKSREQFVFKRMQRFVRYAFQNSSDVYAFLFGLKNLECSGVELKISLRSWNYFYKTEK
jgi:small subunit ribosomal protein S10